MSEKLQSSGETGGEALDLSAESDRLKAERNERLKESNETGEASNVEALGAAAKEQAVSGAEKSQGEAPKDTSKTQYGVQKELKAEAYKNTLRRVRRELKPSERAFSKLIHSPRVEAVSVVAAKTIARPSGILGGGLAALIGSSIVLYMASYYGFTYNFSVFLILLVGGFALGVLVEFLARALRRNRA